MLNKVPLIILLTGNYMFPYYQADFNYYLLHIIYYQYHKHINKSEFAKYNEIIKPKGSIQLY